MTLRWPEPDGSPTCGVIGWPVTYSLSPAIHNAAFHALDMDWNYVHLPVPEGEMPEAMERLVTDGYRGANVTIPHKTEAAQRSVWLSEDADVLNAVNTLAPANGGLAGHNTDAPGFSRFLAEDACWSPEGRSALIFGAGGAARACLLSMARDGLRTLTLAVRDPARAERVGRLAEDLGLECRTIALSDAAESPADIIVNATPLGRQGEPLPLPSLDRETLVVDLLYGPGSTPLLEAGAEVGARTFGGLGLLVHQAVLSFELWTGRTPPLEVMREAAAQGSERA